MSKKDPFELYFIALIPEESVFSEIMAFKSEISNRFNSKAALRSPPHITLHMPFKWKQHKEELLFNTLQGISSTHEAIRVKLNCFGVFEPRVIYVHVNESVQLANLQKEVVTHAARDWHIYSMRDGRPFRPHVTIAFRDLKKDKFYEAWKEFEQRKYNAEMTALNLTLLKHNGKSWDVFQNLPLL